MRVKFKNPILDKVVPMFKSLLDNTELKVPKKASIPIKLAIGFLDEKAARELIVMILEFTRQILAEFRNDLEILPDNPNTTEITEQSNDTGSDGQRQNRAS